MTGLFLHEGSLSSACACSPVAVHTCLPLGAPFHSPLLLAVHKQKLATWVAIQSVSAWPEKRGEIRRMMEVAAADIQQLGGSVELVDIGKQKVRPAAWRSRSL